MPDPLLQEKVELTKGKHSYSYDPSGFEREHEDFTFPVFSIDDLIIRVDIPHISKGAAHMVCECEDYRERERRFYTGETYKWHQKSIPDFGWDCVATCTHP